MEEVEVTEAVTVREDVLVGSSMKVKHGYLDLRSSRRVARTVFILAESVPSWMFLSPLLGCKTLVVYVANPVTWFLPPSLDNVTIKVEASMVLTIGSLGLDSQDDTLVLLHGLLGFVIDSIDQIVWVAQRAKYIALYTGQQLRLVLKLCSYKPPLILGSFSHSDIGG